MLIGVSSKLITIGGPKQPHKIDLKSTKFAWEWWGGHSNFETPPISPTVVQRSNNRKMMRAPDMWHGFVFLKPLLFMTGSWLFICLCPRVPYLCGIMNSWPMDVAYLPSNQARLVRRHPLRQVRQCKKLTQIHWDTCIESEIIIIIFVIYEVYKCIGYT